MVLQMSKVYILGTIICFWLLLPFVFGFLGMGGFDSIKNDLEDINKLSIQSEIEENDSLFNSVTKTFDYIKIVFKFLGVYVKILFVWVDNLPLFFNLFLILLRVLSGIVIMLIIRGV